MRPCAAHPESPSVTLCPECLRPICERCLDEAAGEERCSGCAAAHREQRRGRRILFAVLSVAALLTIGTLAALRIRWVAPPPRTTPEISALRAHLAQAPCDGEAAADLGDALLGVGADDEVEPMADAFAARCGRHARLLWKVYGAASRRRQWEKALTVATDLIEHDPDDHDYWWWRGVVYERLGRLDEALSDYRHTLALAPGIGNIPFNAASILERQERPCEAAEVIEQFVRHHPESREEPEIRRHVEELRLRGRCPATAPSPAP